jgi:hypothetical protein
MILRLLLTPGQHLEKQNLHIVWLRWLALASNLQKGKKGYIVQTNCHASTGQSRDKYASQGLAFHKFGTG